ncbi:MAG: hypothetical protein HOI67_11480 [Gammaproteobacteria bacterium]|nr:hypothetical protein [Gammaproteobacteria bacterium]
MTIPSLITSLARTDLIMFGMLMLSMSASVLIPGTRHSPEPTVYASPVPTVDTLPTHQVDTLNASNIASAILPKIEVESRAYPSTLPDFSAIKDVSTKKQMFFNYMLPKVRQANDKILADRRLLMMIRDDLTTGDTLDPDDIQFIGALKTRYRAGQQTNLRSIVDDLLIRVDVVPESLVLAQAANESGWGTSRFARQANNLFGIWCFSEGCGLTPKNRDEGLTHEVTKYETVQEGLVAYIHTINTNPAYTYLRDIRATTRSQEQHFSGLALAEGLLRYSSRGIEYVRDIQQLIRVNELQKYTLPLQA